MENNKRSRGRPRKQNESDELKALQERQHHYYLKYKNKKKKELDDIPEAEQPEKELTQKEKLKKKLDDVLNEALVLIENLKQMN